MVKIRKASEKLHELGFRLMPLGPQLLTGATAGLAALSAVYGLFGPFSGVSAIQLAAGPEGTELGEEHRDVLFSPTGRGWAAAEAARVANAASAAAQTQVDRSTVPAIARREER